MSEIPPRVDGLAWESFIDRKIREARDEGAFDDLAATGRPLRDLDQPYDEAWWTKNKLRAEGVAYVPRALELRREIERELEALAAIRSESEVRLRLERMNARIRASNANPQEGPALGLGLIDLEGALTRWRSARAASLNP